MKSLLSSLSLVALSAVSLSAHAIVWNEIGDAGQLPATAQKITGSGALTEITGRIVNATDLYRFVISSPATFSATTVGGTNRDTQLFLFTANGMGIAFNDDTTNAIEQSTLPAGNALYASLPVGEYLLGLSQFNRDPRSSGGSIFGNNLTGIHGATGAGGASPLTGWNGSPNGSGNYRIFLTGAAPISTVPEPGSVALLIGMTSIGGMMLRRRNKQ